MRSLVPVALGAALAIAQDSNFESRVRPVLAAKCYSCHGPDRQFSDLRLDSREAILKGGQRGPAPDLIRAAIRHDGALKMPPTGKLSADEIAALDQWIAKGFPWPNAKVAKERMAPHWAFQPLTRPAPKTIDQFLQTVAGPADKRTLARRAAYVVTGLPPSPEPLNRFLADTTKSAWPNYIDELLKSPRYGERWARHWLDVVRFAETYGYEWNYEIHGAWRYRDYLIRAFNQDLPYNQFIKEHVAGDLLPQPRTYNNQNESVLATAFYRFGEMGHDNCNQFREIRTDVVDNQIDTLTKAFQGLTVSCARCHDHKFDPIPTEDYYALYGILNSSRPITQTLNAAPKPNLEPIKSKVRAELAAIWLREAAGLSGKQIPSATQSPAPSVSFANGVPPGWSASGLGLEAVKAGDFALSTQGPTAVEIIFPNGLATNAATGKWNGTLRSPILPRDKKFLTFQLGGANAAAHRTVMDHCVIGEDHKLIESPGLHLEKVPTRNDQPLQTYLELNTITDNPRLPERPGKFKTNPSETAQSSWFVVTNAWFHNEDDAPKPAAAPARGEAALPDAIRRWSAGQATDDDVFVLNWALENHLLSNNRTANPALEKLIAEYRAVEAKLETPAVANTLADLDPGADYPILLSGQALNPGRPAPRHFISLMPENLKQVNLKGSGRQEMAEAIASPENPLTARVYVNRIWHHVFGRGIVETTDNFGRLSDPPSNRDLLDHLAGEFMKNDWSTKRLIKELLLSQAFQNENQVRRLDAESVRDSLLFISGRLDETMYGPSIQPRRHEPTDHRRLFQGPLDGDGRRSVYLKITRMEGPKFLEIFDFPAPLQTRGNRDVTNVPTQSLAMLNDPFVHDQAKVWAEKLVARKDDTIESRLTAMFNEALTRPPTAAELTAYKRLLTALGKPSLTDVSQWQKLAHTLFNGKEFLYLR
ncbi:MAG: PSD1 and planctomycete cytochrome C domain-containing protein [Bryobacteraceae bacterium]